MPGLIHAQIPQVDYLAVCDTKQEKLGDLAAATNADMRTSDYEEAIRDDRVGAVFVSTDEENHHGPAALAAELGKPVLIEKPFVLDLDEADDILAKASTGGSEVFVEAIPRGSGAVICSPNKWRNRLHQSGNRHGHGENLCHRSGRRSGGKPSSGTQPFHQHFDLSG